jgi:hypothetical protein
VFQFGRLIKKVLNIEFLTQFTFIVGVCQKIVPIIVH